MNFQTFVKTIVEKINHDLIKWINANKIAPNISKTDFVILSQPKKQLDHELKLRFNGKKLYQADSVKYLKIHLDKYFTWKHHINNAAIKLKEKKMQCYPKMTLGSHKNSSINLLTNFWTK